MSAVNVPSPNINAFQTGWPAGRIEYLRKSASKGNIYTVAGCCIRNILVFLFFEKTSISTGWTFALGTNFSRLLSAKNCTNPICIYKSEEKVGRTCKDNFHELDLIVSLRFSRIIIVPRFAPASTNILA